MGESGLSAEEDSVCRLLQFRRKKVSQFSKDKVTEIVA